MLLIVFPLSTLNPGNHWSFYYLHSFLECCIIGTMYCSTAVFSDWLLSLVLCIHGSSVSFHGLKTHLFLRLNNTLLSHTHLPTERHLDYFHVLMIMNTATINVYWFGTYIFSSFGWIPRNTIAGSYGREHFVS